MCSRHLKCWSSQTKISTDLELHHRQLQSQPSTSQVRTEPVVCVRNGCKHYGTNRNPLVVLDGLNLTVPKGTIYGLLGASGCGKTTLLGCILGQKKLNSGQVWVLGGSPGTKSSGVPGPRIGYMPQETALFGDFTIQETLVYFGWVAGLDRKQIQRRSDRITKLLMLPETNQRVKTLSGGEQRRVSFVSVLLYEPELLILDEPTVGVDPLLRESIWNYLLEISTKNSTTIIITTHYIEELRQAHIVGLMRGGELLAEDVPGNLLTQYRTKTLEEVYLKLSVSQNTIRQHSSTEKNVGKSFSASPTVAHTTDEGSADNAPCTLSLPKNDNFVLAKMVDYLPTIKANRLKAQIWKNVLWWKRNIGTLILDLLLSIAFTAGACLCIGTDPRNLSVAVINYETNNSVNCSTLTCNSTYISCNYFEYLKKHSSIFLTYHTSEDEVKENTFHGTLHASLIVPYNYSAALRARIDNWADSMPWDIKYSNIDVFQDVYNYQVAIYLKMRLYDAFQDFIRDYLQACDLNPKVLSTPMKWEIPVYGLQIPSSTDAVFPGMILALILFLSITLTAGAILVERNESSLERTFAMGITTTELLISHIVCELVITVLQSTLALTTAITFFDVIHKGSMALALLFTVLVGVVGMCYGILISCVCDDVLPVYLLAIGSCLPTLLLCGALWPLEGIHHLLRPFATISPLTTATECLRNILQKNWDLSSEVMYRGFIFLSTWIMIFLILSIVTLKFKKR